MREIQDDPELHDLRGLDRQDAQPQPAAGALDRDPQSRHEHDDEAEQAEQQEGDRHRAKRHKIDTGHDHQEDEADREPHQLAFQKIRRVAEAFLRHHRAGAVDHADADGDQNQRQHKDCAVGAG